jgi:hypothetical protein
MRDRPSGALLTRLLVLPAGQRAVRVPAIADNTLGAHQTLPPIEEAMTASYLLRPVQQIAVNLGLGRAETATRAQMQEQIVAELTDPERVRALADAAPAPARAVLDRLLVGTLTLPTLSFESDGRYFEFRGRPDTGDDPHGWLARRGLLIPDGFGKGRLAREVAVALGGAILPFRPDSPIVATVKVAAEQVRGEAQNAAAGALAVLEALLAELSATPAVLRKDGGIAVREMRRLAKHLATPESHIRFWADLAAAADLLGIGTRSPMTPPPHSSRPHATRRG